MMGMLGEQGVFWEKLRRKKFPLENSEIQGEFHGRVCRNNQPIGGLCRPHDQSRLEISIVGI